MKNFSSGSRRNLFGLQSALGISSYRIYQSRQFSNLISEPTKLVYFNEIQKFEDSSFIPETTKRIKNFPFGLGLDLSSRNVLQILTEDIESSLADKFSQIILASQDDIRVLYGEMGVVPSATKSPIDLLRHQLLIPSGTYGILDIRKHVPFLIEVKNPEKSLALGSGLSKVLNHEENIKRHSLDLDYSLTAEDAKRHTLTIQTRIYHDRKNEYFYEEVTSVTNRPSKYNKSSGTLMNFESAEIGVDKTTDMHYHPGDRFMQIITTNKRSGATLNFCGIAENPDDRKDCEVHIPFPANSALTLQFPAYTHHKFHGDFVCKSIHPKEGDNLIKALENGDLSEGFLKGASIFSATTENQRKWNLSLPPTKSSPTKMR